MKCVLSYDFLILKNAKPAAFHRHLVEIYCDNVIADGVVRKRVRQFKNRLPFMTAKYAIILIV